MAVVLDMETNAGAQDQHNQIKVEVSRKDDSQKSERELHVESVLKLLENDS